MPRRQRRDPQRFGRMLLERCVDAPAYCGRIERPLDPRGIVAGRISIHFELYPHSGAGPARGMLVATEGGPGYPATESRADYLALFAPLHASRDVLLMDNRGTGKSGAIDCAQLQRADHWTVELVGACGASLAERSALYSTAYAADDLAAILEALGAGPIDLYGDSYGTYFEQVFAVLHPHALRSIVLDGAYPLEGPDYAWYPTYAPAMRDKFNIACRRSASCAQLPGDSLDHIAPVLAQLRREPFMARAADGEGRERSFRSRCGAARDRHVRQRTGACNRQQRGRCRGACFPRGRPAAAPAANGGDRERRRFARPRRRPTPLERGPRGCGDVSGPAADFRYAPAARGAPHGSRARARRAAPCVSRYLRAVQHR